MGYIKHHAIVVTSCDKVLIHKAHNKGEKIFANSLTEIIRSEIGGYYSFFIPPDGSKEGWDESDLGDKKRETFLNWLDKQAYEDGSNSISYAEFFYGDDNGDSEVISHN